MAPPEAQLASVKRRKKRTNIEGNLRTVLEDMFRQNPRPPSDILDELAKTLDMKREVRSTYDGLAVLGAWAGLTPRWRPNHNVTNCHNFGLGNPSLVLQSPAKREKVESRERTSGNGDLDHWYIDSEYKCYSQGSPVVRAEPIHDSPVLANLHAL